MKIQSKGGKSMTMTNGVVLLTMLLIATPAMPLTQVKSVPGKSSMSSIPKQDALKKSASQSGVKQRSAQTKKSTRTKPPSRLKEQEPVVGKTASGKPVYEGTRGGHYYVNEKGEREYVKDFVGAKIVGKTDGGDVIYEGPRGGRFYYDLKGEKRYLKARK